MAKKVSSKKSLKKKVAKALAARRSGKAAMTARRAAAAPLTPPPGGLKKSPLSKADLEKFRDMLMEKRRSIRGDMNHMEDEALGQNRQEGSGDLSLMPDHPANIATDNFEQEFTLGLLESERTLLKEINEALDRIDAGVYGICLGTGQAISKARLMARPWAKFCIEYARMLEKGLIRPPDESEGSSDQDEEPKDEEPKDEDDDEVEEDVPDAGEE